MTALVLYRRLQMSAGSVTLHQAWKWSKSPYSELIFKSSQLISNPGTGTQEAERRLRSMVKQSRTSKIVYTIFICLGACIPYVQYALDPSPISLVSATALGLMLSFAYLVIYSLLVLPSFADAGAYSLLLSMPLTHRDYSRIALFSFVRTFDYLAACSVLVPVSAVALFTHSVLAASLMLAASVMNAIFAIFAGLWLSRQFYKTISRGGRSRGAVLSRTVFIVLWGVAVLSVGFAFNIAVTFLPYVNQVLSGDFSFALGAILSLIHPFTFGMVISSVASSGLFASGGFGSGAMLFSWLSYGATAAYALIAYAAVGRMAHILSDISHGHGVAIERVTAKEFTLKLRSPLVSYITKDIRIALKSPSTAFVLAFPAFEVILILASLSGAASIAPVDYFAMTMITATLALFAGHFLLEAERKGLVYTLSLPLGRRLVVESKSIVSTLVYLPVPFVLLALQISKAGSLSVMTLFPFIEMLALSSATATEIAIMVTGPRKVAAVASRAFRRTGGVTGSRPLQLEGFSVVSGSNMLRMVKAVVAALLLLVLPVAVFIVAMSLAFPEVLSIALMAAISALEFGVVHLALRSGQ